MAFFDQICLGDGQCMVPGHKDNEFTYSNKWKCTNNCKPVKCSYNIICGNQQPQWILNENDDLCVYCNINGLECRTTHSEVIIHSNKECPICLEEKDCVQYIKCDHHVCVSCYKQCFSDYVVGEPKFPYSEDVQMYYYLTSKELRHKFWKNYPLLEQYDIDWENWHEGIQEKYDENENLRKCPLCRL